MTLSLEASLRDGKRWSVSVACEEETHRVGSRLATFLAAEVASQHTGVVVVLEGTLGAGKTRLAQAILASLGGDPRQVVSPTFVLRRDYETETCRVYHFDVYRLESSRDFVRLGPDECFDDEAITLIEWGDKFADVLPSHHLRVSLDIIDPTTRDITIAWSDAKVATNPLHIELREEASIDASLDAQLKQFLADTFPGWADIFRCQRVWHRTPPLYSFLAWDDEGRLVGHVAAVVRVITTTWNWRYSVASVQGVSVAPEARHRGIGQTLLTQTLDEARRRHFPFAVLYCREPLVAYYQRLGWMLADDSVVMRNDRDLPIAMHSNCPMYFVLGETPFPEGPLDIHSPEELTKPVTTDAIEHRFRQ